METIVKSGVSVIVVRDKKVLVGKRTGSHGDGLWAFPGGHIEPTDKSLKECGEREVYEETDIVCNVLSPDGFRQDLFTTFDILSEDKSKIYVTCYLLAEYLKHPGLDSYNSSTIKGKEPDKCQCWHWKTLDELIDELIDLIQKDPNSKSWIPLNNVIYYLNQYWN